MNCSNDVLSAHIVRVFERVERQRDDMHVYQDEAADFLHATPFSALFVDLGMGKSIISLTVIANLIQNLPVDEADEPILIIGPRRVATQTWPNEIAQWQHTAWLDFDVVHVADDDPRVAAARRKAAAEARGRGISSPEAAKIGQRAETAEKNRIREALARSPKHIHIISRDWVEWLVELWQKDWPYRVVFIDESSSFKDYKSGRVKALMKVRKYPGLITRMHQLTATPAAETYEHLFAQIYLLDRGERFGQYITKFRQQYFTENRWSRKWEIRPGAEDEILDKIADICLVMKADDYLDIAKPTILPYPVYLDDKSMALYREMESEFVVSIGEEEVEAETAAGLSAKLLQIASGVLYDTKLVKDWDTDDMKKVLKVHDIHRHKLDALEDIVESAMGQPMIVTYHFKSSLARLKKAYPKAVVMDPDAKCLKKWNAGKIPMLLMHPMSGGHGLNMQAGGHLMVMYDLPWSLELFLQVIGRLARQGQKHHVVVRLLTAIGTLDEAVWASLEKKTDAQEKLFRMLKAKIKAHLAKKKAQAGR